MWYIDSMTQDVSTSDVFTVSRPPVSDDIHVGKPFLVDRFGILMWGRISGVNLDKHGGYRISWSLYEDPDERPLLGNPRINGLHELEVVRYQGVEGVRKAVHVSAHKLRKQESARIALAALSGSTTIPDHLCPACGRHCSHSGTERGSDA